ncbi:hypothetical protein K501DRAFT_306465 [Backusella circina FSU 941]|nr:hypothetical protein K501DRAFT_306465 [Backusella circina FSU 941]
MIIDDPAPTLHQCPYPPSAHFQDFIENCLVKSPLHRYTIHHALNHPFLKRASGPQLLKTYLSRRPHLDRSHYCSNKKTVDNDSSWDELDFIETTWDFDRHHHDTDSPITPDDDDVLPFFKIDLVLSKPTEEY